MTHSLSILLMMVITVNLYPTTITAESIEGQEVNSILLIQELVNIERIQKHMVLWLREVEQSTDKLDKLMAVKVMREANVMVKTLLMATGYDPNAFEITRDSPPQEDGNYNHYRRQKRNILGDILHTLTGVATDDELHKQMKIDEEIREKIAVTLNRQVAYEKTLATTYANLSMEEERLHERVDELDRSLAREKFKIKKMAAVSRVAMDDVKELEDIVSSLHKGEPTTKHAAKLSQKAGQNVIVSFSVHNTTKSPSGPVIWYRARLITKVQMDMMEEPNYKRVDTPTTAYIVHNSFDPISMPLTEMETRINRLAQDTAMAKLVHIGHGSYKTVQGGMLTCKGRSQNLTVGSVVKMEGDEMCSSGGMSIGNHHMRTKVITIKMDHDSDNDLAFLQKTMTADKLRMEQRSDMATQHLHNNLQLQHDLNMAQRDIDTFLTDTKTNMDVEYVQDTATWAVMGGLTLFVSLIIGCILFRLCAAKKNSPTPTVILPMTNMPTKRNQKK